MTEKPRVPLPALIVALLVPMFGALVYFVWSSGGVITQTFFAGTKIFNWVFPAVVCLVTGVGFRGLWKSRDNFERKVTLAKSVGLGVVSGLVVSVLTFALLYLTPMGEVVQAGSGNVAEKLIALGAKENYLALALFISFVNSAMEEYYWRWFVYGNLRDHMKVGLAHLVAAIGFSLHHIVVTMQFFRWDLALFLSLCVGIGGAMWSWMYQRQGTVIGAWVSHIIIDLMIMWVGYEIVFGG